MNNAAISPATSSWDHYDQWKNLLDVNLYGVLNGQMAFVGDMIAQVLTY
jgi:NADP-dependent 3-hydroxy acid dehydrogenase YdfG